MLTRRISGIFLTIVLCSAPISFAGGTVKRLSAELLAVASVHGTYKDLIQVVNCNGDPQGDLTEFGDFRDGGDWAGGPWCGKEGMPGYWVWVSPNWYVWKKQVRRIGSARAGQHPAPAFVEAKNTQMPQRWYKSGRDWLALVCTGSACALEPATMEAQDQPWPTLRHAVLEGQNLTFKSDNPHAAEGAIVYFHVDKTRAWLKPGPVQFYPQEPASDEAGTGRQVDLPNGEKVLLQPTTNPYSRPGLSFVQTLQITEGKRHQWLDMGFGDCAAIGSEWLLWAGDLDGDGKPDYIVNLLDEKPIALLLSSKARPGDLTGIDATYGLENYHEGDCG